METNNLVKAALVQQQILCRARKRCWLRGWHNGFRRLLPESGIHSQLLALREVSEEWLTRQLQHKHERLLEGFGDPFQVTPCERRRTAYVYRMLAKHWVWNHVPRGLKVTMLSCFKGFWYKFLAGWAPVPSHDLVALRTREFHERICTKCGKREVADERHVLLSCSVTREYRVRYRPRLRWSTSLPTFMFWNHQQEALVWFVVECIATYRSHR